MDRNSILLPKSDKSSLEAFKTGDWRTLRPEIRTKNSACRAACPISNRIRDYLQLAKSGEIRRAWQILVETNPLPAVLGRVCPHPCETDCLRGEWEQAIRINTIERFLGDLGLKNGWRPEGYQELTPKLLTRQKIAIIGAGPAGLSCAYQLRRMGHWVEIFETEKELGGMLYFGIPAYRLPKDILKREIKNNILSLEGIEVHREAAVDSSTWPAIAHDFDAILIATGTTKSRKLKIDGEEGNPQVISGLEYLKKINLGREVSIGDIVAVVGGGNTAIDAARSAKMNGARYVVVLYRRREEDMPVFEEEVRAAKKEGIEIKPSTTPVRVEKECDSLLKIGCLKMSLGELDSSGRPKPVPIVNSSFSVFAHTLIVAVGEESDLSFITDYDDEKILLEHVFSAGDASLYGAGTVAAAIGSGNRVAQEIDAYLKTGVRKEISLASEKVVGFEDLNTEHLECKLSLIESCLSEGKSIEQKIEEEAERCFSCGACNGCGGCWLYCPDVAVRETEDGKYEINYEFCKGCGICANECPRNAIDMEREVKL